ncbi:MAG TPA: hypothetical protein PLH70_07995 [Bacteroidales bacterium]|nr:hypothetical protein [Bacteroidales bacterium]HPZ04059.1 hypothetical protein [Bacteroidales bacterium]HQB75725.1 hypothetical protein [Bacteroidales bacterium]
MKKWELLNMELRSWDIGQALRLEQTSNNLMRAILRMCKENPKILGNQSSALSFKSKNDLLCDIEEIDSTEYSHLLKMMEIRNQFSHNPNAISFESLDEINPQINKYLEKPLLIDKIFQKNKNYDSRRKFKRKAKRPERIYETCG